MDKNVSLGALNRARTALGIAEGHEEGLYAPIAKQCPIRVDDEVPPYVKGLLVKNSTCACTDSDVVYVDTSLAGEMFTKASEVAGRASKWVGTQQMQDNYRTLLAHEYTHIIMRHVDKGIKFVRANGDKNYPIFALACDIEANRGWGIVKDSDLYKIAVSEDFYPECKDVNGLMNIYRTLKKNYGDEILDKYNKMKENIENEEDEGEEKEDEDGEAQEQSGGSASAGSDGGKGEDDGGASDEEAKREEALQRAVPSMEQMREEIEQKASTMSEEELDEDVEQFNEGNPEAIGTLKGELEEGSPAPTPTDVLMSQYDVYLKRNMDKAMERLKGLVKGSQVKTRVGTYSRQSRREGADGLIRKGIKNKKALAPRILVAMDSSGSMSSTTIKPVATAIGTIAKSLGKTKGSYICDHDAHVRNVQPLSKWEEVVRCYYPGGDNNFDEVLEKAIDLNVEVVLNVGDGYERLWDMELMKRAKQKGIKWFDVQVAGEQHRLEGIIKDDEWRFGKNFIGREIIKVNKD